MTGGRVVVLGTTGRNFAAGMSGGVAFVFDERGTFAPHCNRQMVDLEPLESVDDRDVVQQLIMKHVQLTGSELGAHVLSDWDATVKRFVKVMPRDYKRVLEAEAKAAAAGRRASFTELVGAGVGG